MPGSRLSMVEVAIALGSNIGDKRQNLRQAVNALEDNGYLRHIIEAPVYESEPMYVTEQETFMNSVVVGQTVLSPTALLVALKNLECALGRQLSYRNGPRLIDLDIVLYGDNVVSEASLEIPHPRMPERPFVLQPLENVLPGWIHPVTGQSVKTLWQELQAASSGGETFRVVSDRIR